MTTSFPDKGAISWGIPGFLGAAVLRFLLIAAFRTRIVMIVPLLAVPLILNWVLIFGHRSVVQRVKKSLNTIKGSLEH